MVGTKSQVWTKTNSDCFLKLHGEKVAQNDYPKTDPQIFAQEKVHLKLEEKKFTFRSASKIEKIKGKNNMAKKVQEKVHKIVP